MDISKLSIEYIEAFEGNVKNEGYTQTDKILPYLSVVYPRKGYYEVCVEDDPLSFLPADGGCFVVPPQKRHTIVHHISKGETCMVPRWLFFTVLYDGLLDVTAWFQPPLLLTGAEAAPLIRAIDTLYETPAGHRREFLKLRIAGEILEHLVRVSAFAPAETKMEQIAPAVALVRNHYAEHLTVEMMAGACRMSSSSFHRIFRNITQKTPMQYLNDYRLRQVARLLMLENHTLSDLASRCGFYDEFHLSRSFKAGYGVSPRAYKRQTLL